MDKINFSEIKRSIVYIFYAEKDTRRTPFYVGQTSRGIGRFGDYISANFSASTDFKVGQFARLLEELDYTIWIEYKGVSDRATKEKELIDQFQDYPLINNKFGYNYKTDSEQDVVFRMREYIENHFK